MFRVGFLSIAPVCIHLVYLHSLDGHPCRHFIIVHTCSCVGVLVVGCVCFAGCCALACCTLLVVGCLLVLCIVVWCSSFVGVLVVGCVLVAVCCVAVPADIDWW